MIVIKIATEPFLLGERQEPVWVIIDTQEASVNEHRSDSKNFEILTAGPVRLSKSPARSYRAWLVDEKARIVGEALAPGANVSAIARSNGVDPSQLFAWRRKALAAESGAAVKNGMSAPVELVRFDAACSDVIEILVTLPAAQFGAPACNMRAAARD